MATVPIRAPLVHHVNAILVTQVQCVIHAMPRQIITITPRAPFAWLPSHAAEMAYALFMEIVHAMPGTRDRRVLQIPLLM